MKKRNIYGSIAASLISMAGIAVSGCGDNFNKDFEPISSVDRVVLINGSPRDTTITLTAGGGTRIINISSNTRWTVQVDKGGGWCSTDVLGGSGEESFTITVLENKGDGDRMCTVEVSAVDAEGQQDANRSLTKTITIIQGKSDVSISPSSLEAFPATESNHLFDINANTGWTLEVTYENENTPHFVTVTPGVNMQTVGPDKYEGTGSARFSLHIATNGSDASRLAFLNLTTDAGIGGYTVEIKQNKSEYTFDVTAERRTIEPQGGQLEFGVLSYSAWTVSSSDTSTTFNPASGQGTGELEKTVATFTPNLTDTVRTIKVHFQPTKENYIPQDIVITQQPFNLTFKVTPGTLPGVVSIEGGDYTLNVNSMFDWEITDIPDWLTVTPDNGDQSNVSATLTVHFNENITDRLRDHVITVTPKPTDFYPGVTINPTSVGVMPFSVPVMQYGGQRPAISTPWVSDGIGQEQAEVTFNYYSPYIELSGAGLEWRKAGTSSWTSIPVTITDEHKGTVTVTLNNLDPVTDYEARGYVTDRNGERYTGSVTIPFTTAGRYPEGNDNPTPSR